MLVATRRALATAARFPLDGRSDVAACYSLRRLRLAYTGPLLRVRRSSDNAELDVFPDANGWLRWGTTLSWAAGADLFGVTLHDHSGNGRHLTQATASAQPKLILATNNRPALLFDGVNDFLRSAAFTLNQPHTRYVLYRLVAAPGSGEAHVVAGRVLADGITFYVASGQQTSINAGTTLGGGNAGMPGDTRAVVAGVYNGASSRVEINGAAVTSATGNAGSNNLTGLTVGTRGDLGSANFANAEVQELFEFDTAQAQAEVQARNASMRAAWGF